MMTGHDEDILLDVAYQRTHVVHLNLPLTQA